jgi:hypothetical protein
VTRSGATAAAMAVTLPLGGLVATAITMGFAKLTDYSLDPAVVCIEIALVFATIIAAMVLARRWALRDREPQNTTQAPVLA